MKSSFNSLFFGCLICIFTPLIAWYYFLFKSKIIRIEIRTKIKKILKNNLH